MSKLHFKIWWLKHSSQDKEIIARYGRGWVIGRHLAVVLSRKP